MDNNNLQMGLIEEIKFHSLDMQRYLPKIIFQNLNYFQTFNTPGLTLHGFFLKLLWYGRNDLSSCNQSIYLTFFHENCFNKRNCFYVTGICSNQEAVIVPFFGWAQWSFLITSTAHNFWKIIYFVEIIFMNYCNMN